MRGESFFLVWNPGGNSPRVRHDFEEQAIYEAERLAKNHPNEEFYVLKATHHCKAVTVKTTELFDQFPF
ncbi:hypothetical protein [Pseudoxanthomonas winnipegensis]|uniref:Uncharacterized protein n=1 Tax=Pseudoxanthomonas winnipegensis TaxID=2480810 RepID=A0A4Q8L4Q8_9GAMM|nr:hypothetical protein [Pseudoxanthomonas winnipegensis]TAA20336.1 hypothetical protein EA660_18275 [Pseudoxanthomonas winnipegensis]